MSAITAKASRKMKKYAVLTREPRSFLGSFDFSWEQRKLGEMGQTYTGLSGKTKDDFGHGQARFVTYMNVFSNPISNPEMTEPIEIDPKQNEVEVGDVFFTTSSETPEEVGMSSILLEKRGKTYLNSFCFGFRPSEKIDSYYLAYMLRSESARAKITLLAQGISRYNISKNKVMEIAVSLPSLDEQKMIGQYFSQLDNLITLHQRKCANLCSPSQVVFSLLFATSTFSWEQRKLGELGKITTGSTPSTSIPDYYSDDGIVWVTPTDICENITFESARKLSDLGQQVGRVVPKNTILVTCIASIGKNTMLGNTGSFNQQINGLTPNENESDPYFLLTESALWSAKMKSSAATGTMQIVNRTEFSELKTWLPSLIEQQAISDFFRQLDNLITLHQRECISFTGRADRLILTANKKRTTSSWEQRKLGELALFNPKDELPQTFEYVDLESVVGTEMLSHRTEVKSSAPSRAQRLAHTGDLFYQTVRPYQKNNYLFEKPDNNYVFSTGYAQMRPYVDGYFLLSLVQSERFVKVVLDNCTGTSYPAINANDLAEIEVAAPSDESEAQKIGTIFRSIDNLITLHQRKPFLMKWRTSDANRNQTNRLVL